MYATYRTRSAVRFLIVALLAAAGLQGCSPDDVVLSEDFRRPPTAILAGHVLSPSGVAIRNAQVFVRELPSRPRPVVYAGPMSVDSTGRFGLVVEQWWGTRDQGLDTLTVQLTTTLTGSSASQTDSVLLRFTPPYATSSSPIQTTIQVTWRGGTQ